MVTVQIVGECIGRVAIGFLESYKHTLCIYKRSAVGMEDYEDEMGSRSAYKNN